MNSRTVWTRFTPVLGIAALALAAGCTLEGEVPDVSEYQDVMPEPESVEVAGPETIDTETAPLVPAASPSTDAAAPAPEYAQWFEFTRTVRNELNDVTERVIGSVHFVVHTQVSTVGDDYAEWGPFTLPKDDVTWRLRITRAGEGEYTYELEGRPKAETEDSAFRTVLSGVGYGAGDERHGDGSFSIDIDTARELEPEDYTDETGIAHFTYGVTPDGARTVSVDYDPEGESWVSLSSLANADGSGEFDVTGIADTDAFGAVDLSALEDVTLESRWRADGAGRADIVLSAGDFAPLGAELTIAECWGQNFGRVYYSDSLGVQPPAGDASACALPAAN